MGFGPYFLNLLKAMNMSASSTILIQGKLASPFQLACLVVQGCPLSPLLYLAVANILSLLLTDAIDQGIIKGVFIHEIWEQKTHGRFADDTKIFIEAKHLYVDNTFSIFRMLVDAFGLISKKN